MKVDPIGDKYKFSDALDMNMPTPHLKTPLKRWLFNVLDNYHPKGITKILGYSDTYKLSNFVHNDLQISFREEFPNDYHQFIQYTFSDRDRCLVVLQKCLNEYASTKATKDLENMLDEVGSGYQAITVKNHHNLVERVPEIVKKASSKALSGDDRLMSAWVSCYGRDPNYKNVV